MKLRFFLVFFFLWETPHITFQRYTILCCIFALYNITTNTLNWLLVCVWKKMTTTTTTTTIARIQFSQYIDNETANSTVFYCVQTHTHTCTKTIALVPMEEWEVLLLLCWCGIFAFIERRRWWGWLWCGRVCVCRV